MTTLAASYAPPGEKPAGHGGATRGKRRPSDRDLQSYVDGALDPKRRAEVADALRRNPTLRKIEADYEAQRRNLHRLYDGTLAEPIPESLTRLLRKGPKPRVN